MIVVHDVDEDEEQVIVLTLRRPPTKKRRLEPEAAKKAEPEPERTDEEDDEDQEHRIATPRQSTPEVEDAPPSASLDAVRASLMRFRYNRYNSEAPPPTSAVDNAEEEGLPEEEEEEGEEEETEEPEAAALEEVEEEDEVCSQFEIEEDGAVVSYDVPVDDERLANGRGVARFVRVLETDEGEERAELLVRGNWVAGKKTGLCSVWQVCEGGYETLRHEGEFFEDLPVGFGYRSFDRFAADEVLGERRRCRSHYIGPTKEGEDRSVCFCEMILTKGPPIKPWQSRRVFFTSLDCNKKRASEGGINELKIAFQGGYEMSIGTFDGHELWEGMRHRLVGPEEVDRVRSANLNRTPSSRKNGVVVEPVRAQRLFVDQARIGRAMPEDKGSLEKGWAWCAETVSEGRVTASRIKEPVPLEASREEEEEEAGRGKNKRKVGAKRAPAVKPIRAFFRGTLYASLLELRFSVFLSALGLRAFYEPCVVVLEDEGKETRYTPDFLVVGNEEAQEAYMIHGHPLGTAAPEASRTAGRRTLKELEEPRCSQFEPYWVELKPAEPTKEEMWKMSELVRRTERDGYIFYGSSFEKPGEKRLYNGMRAVKFSAERPDAPHMPFWYAECRRCKAIDITYGGNRDQVRCDCSRERFKTSRYFSTLRTAYAVASSVSLVR